MSVVKSGKEADRASLELLYHISREVAGALDLRTVLHRVLFLSMQNVGAISGSIIVLDDEGHPVDSAFLMRGQTTNQTTLQLRVTFEHGLAGWAARNREAVLVPDTSQDERWLRRPDDASDRTGAKSAISLPILAREQMVGVMTLVHPSPHFFKPEHLELVRAIADQAGIAILNARLYKESQRKARVMTAVSESAAVITASLNLDDVLNRISEQVSLALRVELASIALIDPRKKELEYRASTKQGARLVGSRLPVGQGISGWVAMTGQGLVVPDVSTDSRYYAGFDSRLGLKTRAMAVAPILSQGQVIGVMDVRNPQEGAFDDDAMIVLNGISSLAGTAIRHAQLFESLDAAHQRYRDLFQDSIDPILITNWDGQIQEANRQAEITTGHTSSTLRQRRIGDLHPIDQEKVGAVFEKLLLGDTISYEAMLTNATGREIPIQVNVRQVSIDGLPYLQWILRDITERRNLDRLRDDLASMIYHDLRSPLGNIVSSLDVLGSLLPADGDPSVKSLVNIAVRSTERIMRLTNSLLDISRMEDGQEYVNRTLVTPRALVEDALEAVRPIAQGKGQELIVDADASLPEVLVDGDMIRRVLINLLENAVKYSPAGGKITVGACQEDQALRMWVQDTGPGIPPAERERIFDKFTRLPSKDGTRGFGLGLAYCRLAIESHGGRIWVESEADRGSNFIFILPLTSQASPPPD